jgi:hypothetical protein
MPWKIIIAIAALAGVAWLYPLLSEGTGLPCGALATRAVTLHAAQDPSFNNALTMGVARTLGDFGVSQMVRRRYPSAPPELICVGYFWYLIVDPSSFELVWSDLGNGRPYQ